MTQASDAATQVFDPLRQGVELPLQATFYPLGFPLQLSTNSSNVLTAAEENWSGFVEAFSEPPIRVRIAVDENDPGECPTTLKHRAQGHLLALISDPANFAICDLARGFAFCWVTPATARNRAWLRYYYLDTIAYLTLWQQHLTRIHASCVALDGHGVLLCGPSGAGKSCLAYACARKGWAFISDEATSIVRNSRERTVLGKPHFIRFRETAPELLPELNGRSAEPNPVGKMTIEVGTAELGIPTAFRCRAEAVVFLNRETGGAPRLVPLTKNEAWRRLEQDLPLFEQLVHEEHKASIRNLLQVNVFELCAFDLESGVKQLELLARGGMQL